MILKALNSNSVLFFQQAKLETMENEKKFEFSEMYIFGKFDTFTRRLKKIIEMFETMEMYSHLADSKIEGKLTDLSVCQIFLFVCWSGI